MNKVMRPLVSLGQYCSNDLVNYSIDKIRNPENGKLGGGVGDKAKMNNAKAWSSLCKEY
jgi:hypothetical protein